MVRESVRESVRDAAANPHQPPPTPASPSQLCALGCAGDGADRMPPGGEISQVGRASRRKQVPTYEVWRANVLDETEARG